jgi:Dehydrogenases with different specificities (related to short-chain alcohol dehydrogenases)
MNCIITGANGNLGTAVVKKFLADNHTVVGVDHGDKHLDFAKGHPNFTLHTIDLANETATRQFVEEAINKNGTIHAGILLAGGFAMGTIANTGITELRDMFSLNFETAYNLARPLFRHMMQKGYGRLIFTGARPGIKHEEGTGKVAYALSKSLLFTLADILNKEAKGANVVTSVIVPSTIDTPPNRQSMPDADPNKWVKPEQIAELLSFICSEKGDVLREPVYKVYNNA